MIQLSVGICLFLQTFWSLSLTTRGEEVFIAVPYVSGRWEWEFQFFYHTNSGQEIANYTFKPEKSTFIFDPAQVVASENKSMLLLFEPDVTNSKLTKVSLTILVIREKEFFAWTNMTLEYTFESHLPNMNASIEPLKRNISTTAEQKFYTKVDEVYECVSRIPINFGTNATIVFQNMTFQAFEAEEVIRSDRSREVCPRDFKSNVPITALTGASLLVLVVIAASGYGINVYIEHKKRKQN